MQLKYMFLLFTTLLSSLLMGQPPVPGAVQAKPIAIVGATAHLGNGTVIENAIGGEIFVPKLPSYLIGDVATAIAPDCEQRMVGIRPGEKLHEEMITQADSFNTIELDNHYVICPTNLNFQGLDKNNYLSNYAAFNAKPVPVGFSYNSGDNSDWMTVEDIREVIKTHVDPHFEPNQLVEAA